jgi:soluble lytic murein transglycosylase-like protein
MPRPALTVLTGLLLLVAGCARKTPPPADPATPDAVWTALQPHAARYRIEPGFIYALVAAESNFNARAQNGEARGLLQLKPGAWREVSREPYEPAVWAWRKNLAAGVEYLAWSRSYLHRRGKFSYPLLLATFHYGVDYVEQHDLDLRRIEPPDNPVYQELWRGNLSPLAPPETQIPR